VDSWQNVDIGFASQPWEVGEYEVRDEVQRGLVDRPVRQIKRVGTAVRRRWLPPTSGVADDIAALSETDEQGIVGWVRRWGFVGVEPPAKAETVEDIQAATRHLAGCRRLLRSVETGNVDLDLAREVAGSVIDADYLAGSAGSPSMAARFRKERTERAPAAVQGLDALARSIAQPLQLLASIDSFLIANEAEFRLHPKLMARSPLGLAYLETLGAAARQRVPWEDGDTYTHWRPPKPCVVCGRVFLPRRSTAVYCSRQCKWTATKRAQRARTADDEQEDEQ
jgi:hypothetical protein